MRELEMQGRVQCRSPVLPHGSGVRSQYSKTWTVTYGIIADTRHEREVVLTMPVLWASSPS